MPLRPSGLRTMHIAGAGLLLGMAAPFGLLFGVIKYDPRARSPAQIERGTGVRVLGVMPAYRTRQRRKRTLRNTIMALMLVMVVPLVYASAYAIKFLDFL